MITHRLYYHDSNAMPPDSPPGFIHRLAVDTKTALGRILPAGTEYTIVSRGYSNVARRFFTEIKVEAS